MTHAQTSALDDRILACAYGAYPWDEWQARALAAGLSEELATLGRSLMREAYNHDWPKRLQRECGWKDEGAAMVARALKNPTKAAQRWQWLISTDGERCFDHLNPHTPN